MKKEIYSYTSNTTKLLKHLDKLQKIQHGQIVPIMIHNIPTHKCQLNCVHCCFKNKKDKTSDMDFDLWKEAIDQFHILGTRALEFTGGGDPTMWPHLEKAIDYLKFKGWSIGMITNGVNLNVISNWNKLNWVRISLNTLDYKNTLDLTPVLNKKVDVSFCYIWNELSDNNINNIIDFANEYEIVCRLAPDCIKPVDDIENSLIHISNVLKTFNENEYVILSDFNIDLVRLNNDCRIHMIKPCLYLDGYVYACPSSELAVENNRQMCDNMRICNVKGILSFYTSEKAKEKKQFSCSYCKYVQQQEFLEKLFAETKHNEFA